MATRLHEGTIGAGKKEENRTQDSEATVRTSAVALLMELIDIRVNYLSSQDSTLTPITSEAKQSGIFIKFYVNGVLITLHGEDDLRVFTLALK